MSKLARAAARLALIIYVVSQFCFWAPTVEAAGGTIADHVVIAEVYSGISPLAGLTKYKNGYIQLYNPRWEAQTLDGLFLQIAGATGVYIHQVALTGTIPAHGYYLISLKANGNGGLSLPSSDKADEIAMVPNAGRIALTSNGTVILDKHAPTIIDFVGYGAPADGEYLVSPAGSAASGKALTRRQNDGAAPWDNSRSRGNGYYQGNNSTDFSNGGGGSNTPYPYNTATPQQSLSSPALTASFGAILLGADAHLIHFSNVNWETNLAQVNIAGTCIDQSGFGASGIVGSLGALRIGASNFNSAGDYSVTVQSWGHATTNPVVFSFSEPYRPVNSLTLIPTAPTLRVGNVCTLVATVTPTDATDPTVGYLSDNPAVASVAATTGGALVTALTPGRAQIIVTAEGGTVTAGAIITVRSAPASSGSSPGTDAPGPEGPVVPLVPVVDLVVVPEALAIPPVVGAIALPILVTLDFTSPFFSLDLDGVRTEILWDEAPFLYQGRTMVALRTFADIFQLSLNWEPVTRGVLLDGPNAQIAIYPHHGLMTLDGEIQELDVPILIRRGRTFVPASHLGRFLGITVQWHPATRTVTLQR